MKQILVWAGTVVLVLSLFVIVGFIGAGHALAYNTTHSLHGSRASFLMIDDHWMTLHYLHPNANKTGMINAGLANGDTHFYIYSRNGGDNGGPFDLDHMEPQSDWEAHLQTLVDRGLKPVMWLTPDDSPTITNRSIDAQKAHFDSMVQRFDDQVTAYVVCLECDEYWGAAKVNELTRHLKTRTDKPVAVHLTSGVGGHKGNLDYYKGADYVFLQTGWDRTPEEIAAMVKQARAATGLPVVLSEYALESRSAAARALGDAGCAAGAVGTGNGRSITFCGYEEPPKPKNRSGEALAIGIGAVILAAGAYYLYTNYDFVWIWEFSDSQMNLGMKKEFQPWEDSNTRLGFDVVTSVNNDSGHVQNRYLFSVSGNW